MKDAIDLVQRSPEWFSAICGSLGGSRVGASLKRLQRGGWSQIATDLAFEIAAERLTGVNAKRGNAIQWWGVDHEAEARQAYAFLTNEPVVEIGLIPHPTIAHAHVSPDALVGEDGGLEIKCPTSATHLQTLLANEVPEEHLPQIYWALACTGRRWWDFVSYDPRFPEGLQFVLVKVLRDEEVIAKMEKDVRAFLAEVEDKVATLQARLPTREEA